MLRRFVLLALGCAGTGCAASSTAPSEAPEAAPLAPAPPPPAAEPASAVLVADAGSPEVGGETAAPSSCTVSSLETIPTKESRNDQCRGTFFCPGARTVLVTCDGENDGTNTSLCDCEERGKRASLSSTVPGEAPDSCLAAADRCLAALGR